MCFYAHEHTYTHLYVKYFTLFQKKKNQILSTHLIFVMMLRISEKKIIKGFLYSTLFYIQLKACVMAYSSAAQFV